MSNTNSKFNKLAEIMAGKESKVKELAELIGATGSSVTNWRKQHKQPNLVTIYKMAAALNVHPRELLADVNPFAQQTETNGKA